MIHSRNSKAVRLSLVTRHLSLFLVAVPAGVLLPAVTLAQGRIEGHILDGTTGRAVPNQEVRLLAPRQGMEQVATASTDAGGAFTFAQSAIDPNSFYLLETTFQGVRYHEPVQFGSTGSASVSIKVYDSTSTEPPLRVQLLRILVRAAGSRVQVREEYGVENQSQPPRAYANPKGTFRFNLPAAAGPPSVAVTGLMNMQLPQTAEAGQSPGEFLIRYPLKPGSTTVTADYEADYSAAKLVVGGRVPYPIDRAEMYVFPSTVGVDSTVFKLAGIDSKNSIQKLEAENLPGGASLEARLSGEAAASPPPEPGTGEPSEQGAGEPGNEVKVVPDSMTRLATPILACFLLVFVWALGVRIAKEWSSLKGRRAALVKGQTAQKRLSAKAEKLLNSLADLDELFAAGKIAEKDYWKERLELKARLVENLKKGASPPLESYAGRRARR
jgi:hypothetical protein